MTRLIDWKVLKTLVPWCRVHVKRLENEGKFPKRILISEHRVAWVADEVERFLQDRIRERDEQSP